MVVNGNHMHHLLISTLSLSLLWTAICFVFSSLWKFPSLCILWLRKPTGFWPCKIFHTIKFVLNYSLKICSIFDNAISTCIIRWLWHCKNTLLQKFDSNLLPMVRDLSLYNGFLYGIILSCLHVLEGHLNIKIIIYYCMQLQ